MGEEISSDMSDPSLMAEEEEQEDKLSRRMEMKMTTTTTASGVNDTTDNEMMDTTENHNNNNIAITTTARTKTTTTTTTTIPAPLYDHQETTSSLSNQHGASRPTHTTFAVMSRVLRWYVRFIASAGNQDKLLKVMAYSLKVLCHKDQAWPQKLAMEISFARYVTRLIGWPTALEAAWNDSWQMGTSPTHQWLGRILAYSMILFYPMEHMAYALWIKPSPPETTTITPKRSTSIWCWKAETWSYWSNRCWLVYILAEMAQSILKLHEETQSNNSQNTNVVINSKLQLVRNALYVLPCLQLARSDWDTTTRPWIKMEMANLFLWAESILSIYQAWSNSQEED